MNSIRSYLAIRLLVGFMVLLSLASAVVYLISQKILEDDFDSRLFAKAQAIVASTTQKGHELDVDWANLPQELGSHNQPSNLIEFLSTPGVHLEGNSFVPFQPATPTEQGTYRNAVSNQGEKIRVLTLSFLPAVEEEDAAVTLPEARKPCLLIVGHERTQLDHSLGLMAAVLATMIVLTSLLSLVIVNLVLRRGLHPLASLSLEVAQIDHASLERRIDLKAFPQEVVPVAEKLNELLSRLEISFARERRFSADLSHELRTPVAELKTLSEVMLQQPEVSADMRLAFEDTLGIADQMESLVAALLTLVRQEEGLGSLGLSDVDLEIFTRKAWEKFEEPAKQKHLGVNLVLPMNPMLVWTEPQLFSMALSNLFDNAVEHSPERAVIDIEFHESHEHPCLVISNRTDSLSPSDLPHVFERFWRKDKVRSGSHHFGVGLALTQTICQRLDIQLTVSMEKENLVRFWLHFPTKARS